MIVFRLSPAERPLPNPPQGEGVQTGAPPQPSPRGGSPNWGPSPTLPKGRESKLGPLPNPPQREGVPPNRLKHSKNGLPPLGEGWGGALGGLGRGFRRTGEGLLPSSCFCTGASRTFFTANGGFFYRGHCWRHAWHDGGDGADAQEENLFSDRHWRHPHQGEAASSAHGFLCLFHPHVEASR